MSGLRAYTKNGDKIIDLLAYQKGRRGEQKLSEEEIEVKKTVCEKQAGWRYQERLRGQMQGIEQHSLKWLPYGSTKNWAPNIHFFACL